MALAKGLLLYEAQDAEKNKLFIEWLISEAGRQGLNIEYMSYEAWLSTTEMHEKIAPIQFVINRTRDDVLALNLELSGIRVFNNARVTKVGNHKLWGYHYAKEYHFPYMPVTLRHGLATVDPISKPVDGHGGKGIFVFDHSECAKENWHALSYAQKKKMMHQKKLDTLVGDLRCYVIGGEIIHCVLRKKSHQNLVTNYSQGAVIEHYSIPENLKKRIETFIRPLQIDYAGVDFLIDNEGRFFFNEIEDVVGSRMLSALGINDTVPRFITHIKSKL